MKKDDGIFIEHILENLKDIKSFMGETTKDNFLKNKEKQNAVIRSLEIIGEAVKNVSQETKSKYPLIEWRKISGTRDMAIHSYFNVDIDIIWNIVKDDIPILERQMKKIKS